MEQAYNNHEGLVNNNNNNANKNNHNDNIQLLWKAFRSCPVIQTLLMTASAGTGDSMEDFESFLCNQNSSNQFPPVFDANGQPKQEGYPNHNDNGNGGGYGFYDDCEMEEDEALNILSSFHRKLHMWQCRSEEIYSRLYQPTRQEQEELLALAASFQQQQEEENSKDKKQRKKRLLPKRILPKGGTSKRKHSKKNKKRRYQDMELWNQLLSSSTTNTNTSTITPETTAACMTLPSIVLMRGPCLYLTTMASENNGFHSRNSSFRSMSSSNSRHSQLDQLLQDDASSVPTSHDNDDDHDANHDSYYVECEVLLLTHALVVATTTQDNNSRNNNNNLKLVKCMPWEQIEFIEPIPIPDADKEDLEGILPEAAAAVAAVMDDTNNGSSVPGYWQVRFDPRIPSSTTSSTATEDSNGLETLTLVCATVSQRDFWLEALHTVTTRHSVHVPSSSLQQQEHPPLGWEYTRVVVPGFTMAVCSQYMDKQRPPSHVLATRDEYRGFSPLHYAVTCRNVLAVESLLRIGANPNLPDREWKCTPCDYAQRQFNDLILSMASSNGNNHITPDQSPEARIMKLMETYGGVVSPAATASSSVAAAPPPRSSRYSRGSSQNMEKHQQHHLQRSTSLPATASPKMPSSVSGVKESLQSHRKLLQQRGEQIDELNNKSNDLMHQAKSFRSMARVLKEKKSSESAMMRPVSPFRGGGRKERASDAASMMMRPISPFRGGGRKERNSDSSSTSSSMMRPVSPFQALRKATSDTIRPVSPFQSLSKRKLWGNRSQPS